MLSEPSCARLCDLIGIEDNIGLNMLVCSTMRFVGILVFICFLVAFPSLKVIYLGDGFWLTRL